MALTPYHFLTQLFATGMIISIDQKQTSKDISERTLVKVREYAQFFCDLLTEHYDIMMKYESSKVAVACLYLARQCCQLKKVWTIDLEEYTTYSESSLSDILGALSKNHDIMELVNFSLNNFRITATRQRATTLKPLTKTNQIFEDFLQSRGIADPYKDCTLQCTTKKSKQALQVQALTLHSTGSDYKHHLAPLNTEEDNVVFIEIRNQNNTEEVPLSSSPFNSKDPSSTKQKRGKDSSSRHEKENWDDMSEVKLL